MNASHPSGTPAKLAEPIAVDPAEQNVAGLAPCLRMSAAFQHPRSPAELTNCFAIVDRRFE